MEKNKIKRKKLKKAEKQRRAQKLNHTRNNRLSKLDFTNKISRRKDFMLKINLFKVAY